MIKAWSKLRSSLRGDFRIFQIRSDVKLSPRTGEQHDFFVIECGDWVNVIAVTPDDHLVMVEQYRHGTDTIELEIPGGMIDHDDRSPVHAGTRELREETGYEGETPILIGDIYPNPAIMNNTCHTLLVQNCQLKHPTVFDQSEDLITRLVPVSQIADLVASGKIRHSLVVVALYYFELWRQRKSFRTE